jgi:hypothetical protein
MPSTGSSTSFATLKKRGFGQILDTENKHLTHSKELIAALRRSGLGEATAGAVSHCPQGDHDWPQRVKVRPGALFFGWGDRLQWRAGRLGP